MRKNRGEREREEGREQEERKRKIKRDAGGGGGRKEKEKEERRGGGSGEERRRKEGIDKEGERREENLENSLLCHSLNAKVPCQAVFFSPIFFIFSL